jgi:acetylornithine deacetylase/succinyl-diaminopimelate desuccinylase-like protein
VLSDYDKEQLAKIPDDEVALRKRLGFSKADEVAGTYQESLQYPSLNIRGLQSAYVGASARTIVPAIATAEIDVRLVPESEPYRLMQLIKTHIENQGFTVLDHEPSDEERQQFDRIVQLSSKVSYAAFRTDMNSPIGEWLRSQMNRAGFEDLVQLRLMGGSIPISPFVEALGIDAVIIPTVNADNNQHSPNENIRLGNFREGITTMLSLLSAQGL